MPSRSVASVSTWLRFSPDPEVRRCDSVRRRRVVSDVEILAGPGGPALLRGVQPLVRDRPVEILAGPAGPALHVPGIGGEPLSGRLRFSPDSEVRRCLWGYLDLSLRSVEVLAGPGGPALPATVLITGVSASLRFTPDPEVRRCLGLSVRERPVLQVEILAGPGGPALHTFGVSTQVRIMLRFSPDPEVRRCSEPLGSRSGPSELRFSPDPEVRRCLRRPQRRLPPAGVEILAGPGGPVLQDAVQPSAPGCSG